MNQELPLLLADYPDEPIYNMKAATQRTGIPAATLRAWERRHKVLNPSRTEGNYRLYSERDIAILNWVKAQLDAGLSISRAVALLERLRTEPRSNGSDTFGKPERATEPEPVTGGQAESWAELHRQLHGALLRMDEQRASVILAEAFALYGVEKACTQLIAPCLVEIGEDWFNGRISIATEHFATAYLMGRLLALFNALPVGQGPLVLVACAPGERHEMGALMLALMLRRRGRNVRYLGADIPLRDLALAIREMRPGTVVISAMMVEAAEHLSGLPALLGSLISTTRFVFGGRGFAADGMARQLGYGTVITDIDAVA